MQVPATICRCLAFGLLVQDVSFASIVLRKCTLIHQHVLANRLMKAYQLLTATEKLLQRNDSGSEVFRYLLSPA